MSSRNRSPLTMILIVLYQIGIRCLAATNASRIRQNMDYIKLELDV